MTQVAMLAENGAHRAGAAPADSADFARISATARQATEEMRLLLDTLRARDESPGSSEAHVPPVGSGRTAGSAGREATLSGALEATRLRLTADGFSVRVAVDGQVEPPARMTAVLCRCLSEIEANVLRHGDRCARVALLVEQTEDLNLVVLNGVDENVPRDLRGGAGLDGMAERLAAIGGRVETGREGRTFLTRIEIPARRQPE